MHPGRILRIVATAFIVLLLGRGDVSAQQDVGDLGMSEKAYVASKIYSSLQLYFAHWRGTPDFDLDSEFKSYLSHALNTNSRLDFDLATLEFIARLHNGHTHFFDQWLNKNYGQSLGFEISSVQGKWVVTSSSNERLKLGDTVTAIDGVDTDRFVHDKTRYVAASNERVAISHVASSEFLWPERFTLSLEGGRSVPIERASLHNADEAKPPTTEGRWLIEGQVAYIKIPSFGNADYEARALEYVKEYQRAKSLIIDVRGNGGGMTPWRLIDLLMNRPWRDWEQTTPQHNALSRARGGPSSTLRLSSQIHQPSAGAFAGRLVMLIDRYTGSAAEDFVMPFRDNRRAEVVGETSQGSSGQPYFFDFGNGMRLMVGSVRYNFPDGSEFESVGIMPTLQIETRAEDLRSGTDPILAAALKIAQSQ